MAEDEKMLTEVRKYVDNIVRNSINEYVSSLGDQPVNRLIDNDDLIKYPINTENNGASSDSKQTIKMITKLDMLAEEIVACSLEEGLKQFGKMGRILCVGIVCLDIIFICERYPEEDTENLVDEHFWSRGGNASNTSSVLAYLYADVEFFGTIVENRWSNFLKEDFQKSGVKVDKCVQLDGHNHKSPVSTIFISKATGSRTAFPDFKNVTELTFLDFDKAIQLDKYKWMHFEGRRHNTDIEKMMGKIVDYNRTVTKGDQITVSVEIEQPNSICPELFRLFNIADVVFVSKDYAKDAGFNSMEEALNGLYKNCKPGAKLICPWGDQGAAARWNDDTFTSPAFCPDKLVDTIGAGDTFNGAAIYALYRGTALAKVIEFACRVAGAKCGSRGFTGIKGMQTLL